MQCCFPVIMNSECLLVVELGNRRLSCLEFYQKIAHVVVYNHSSHVSTSGIG